jgi:predicted methyltransferase
MTKYPTLKAAQADTRTPAYRIIEATDTDGATIYLRVMARTDEAIYATIVAHLAAQGIKVVTDHPAAAPRQMTEAELLRQRRADIGIRMQANAGGFPGSERYNAERAAMDEMAAFDRAHPEVIAGIRAEDQANMTDETMWR